jgi:hypothetical protein
MAIVTIAELKTYFETGDRPTQQQFVNLIDTLAVGGVVPNLQQVTTAGFTTNSKIISSSGAGSETILSNGIIEIATNGEAVSIDATLVTTAYNAQLPDKLSSPQTFAMLSDITGGGITQATASGTDTYTATISGVASYADGDVYLIRFTNGNTSGATLNINSLGAKTLYRNNDGAIIGGDIWNGGEMLCIYNSTLNGFQCIGTSPNSIFAYITNADSVTITKGQVVYAFGGVGDRMTVKRAINTSDATSARTVGVVYSSSIAANQKGIIILQGLLDGLSILPTSTYADGDIIYLGATAGSITNVKQYAPNHLVYVGIVTTASNGSSGRMYVKIQNGYELDELHDVFAQTPSNKNSLMFDSSTSLWKARAIAADDINADVSNTEFGYLDGVTSSIQTQLNGKQATLVSGTNIKSVEGSSLLGSTPLVISREIQLACSDETTALTTGAAKVTFRAPRAMVVTGVRASLTTAQSTGSIITVDINDSGTSILSTKLTIDNTEKTSVTAATAPVISDSAIADDAEITIDIDQVGDGTAKGLKITIQYTI